MEKLAYLLIVSGIVISGVGCGGGGGDDDNDRHCTSDKPLYCSEARGCCAIGLGYVCDGICSAVPLTPCAQRDTCEFGRILDSDDGLRNLSEVDNTMMSLDG